MLNACYDITAVHGDFLHASATSFSFFVATHTTRVPGCSAKLIIRLALVTLVRVTWIAILGPVAHALVAVFVVVLTMILAGNYWWQNGARPTNTHYMTVHRRP